MRLKYVDGLRAFAVLAVAMTHHQIYLIPSAFGVTLFFVISGFVITRLLLKEHSIINGFRVKAFFARRALKIIPPFIVAITIPTLLLWPSNNFDLAAILSQHFFYYNWYQITHLEIAVSHSVNPAIVPGSQVVWSLSVEEQFYILIALLWFVLSKKVGAIRSLRATLLVAFLGSTIIRAVIALSESFQRSEGNSVARIIWGTDTRLSGIALGGLLAISASGAKPLFAKTNWMFDHISKNARTYFVIGLSLIPFQYVMHKFTTTTFNDIVDLSLQEVAGFLLLATGLKANGWPNFILKITETKVVQRIGLASYSIYLSHHIFSLYVLKRAPEGFTNLYSGGQGVHLRDYVLIHICFALFTIIPGLIIHQIADAPMEKYRKRWRVQSAEQQPSSAT